MAVVLTLVQKKQIRINIHKRNNTKNTVQIIQNTVNTSKHITKIPAHYKRHTLQKPHITEAKHYESHTLQKPHIKNATHYRSHYEGHTLQKPHITKATHYESHTLRKPRIAEATH